MLLNDFYSMCNFPKMTAVFQKFCQNLGTNGKMAFAVFLLYGLTLFIILFHTVHDRTDEEFEKRMVPRYNDSIMVWINHGYINHGGLAFLRPVQEDPSQLVWRSVTMGYIQLAHLVQRVHVAMTGEFSYFLMALHNQFFPMLSSILLGFLAMRMSMQLNIPPLHALILGLGALTVFQTFPMSLGAIWENYQQDVWQSLVVLFFLRENHLNWKGYAEENNFSWVLLVFVMFYIDPYVTLFFLASYFLILVITAPDEFEAFKFFKSVLIAGACAVLVMVIQINWVKFNHPQVNLSGSSFIYRSGLDGDMQYYSSHLDLLLTQYVPWLPRWKVLLTLGIFSAIAVICMAQRNRKYFNHQTTLLMGIGSFVPMAFFFSQNGVIHPQCYEHLLALPLILALFALLPAWIETYTRHSGIVVLFSGLMAFAFAGIQMLAYWLHMPPYL